MEATGLPAVDRLPEIAAPTIDDYLAAAAEYVREAGRLAAAAKTDQKATGKSKAAQIRLSNALAKVTLTALRSRRLSLATAHAGERNVGGGLRTVQADLSEMTRIHGLTLAIEIKPVHLAVGRAIWNRFGDIRTFAVNVHLKFPFAVVGGIMTVPIKERGRSGEDKQWRSTTHLIARAVQSFMRAGGRETEGDAPHLLEGIAVVAFDPETGQMEPSMPPKGSGLRWDEFVEKLATTYSARFVEESEPSPEDKTGSGEPAD